jgi:hypothetical protein
MSANLGHQRPPYVSLKRSSTASQVYLSLASLLRSCPSPSSMLRGRLLAEKALAPSASSSLLGTCHRLLGLFNCCCSLRLPLLLLLQPSSRRATFCDQIDNNITTHQQHQSQPTLNISQWLEVRSDDFSEILELISIPAGKGKVMTRRANFVGLEGSRSLTLRTDHRWKRRQGRCCRRWKDSKIAQREGISTLLHMPMSNALTDFPQGWSAGTYICIAIEFSVPEIPTLSLPSMRDVEQKCDLRRVDCYGSSRTACA